mgnify:CR=1 FL=1
MKQKSAAPTKAKPADLAALIAEVRNLIHAARRGAASVVDTFQVMTNFEIGRRIVEHEQKGVKRAAYGKELLAELSLRLSDEFGKGFSVTNLQLMRKLFVDYHGRIQQQPAVKLALLAKSQQAADQFEIQQAPTVELMSSGATQPQRGKFQKPFTLSWTHYVLLLPIKDPDARSFYEIEATNEGWSVPELKRQKASCLYERLALSRDKDGIKRLAKEGQLIAKPEDLFKEPYVLEFLGLDEPAAYSETDLESAIISHLEQFLLELGKGFLFEARQKRFTFDEDHYFVDLVFYNRLLRCYVLIDLKLDKLTHQDLGQMQMYVNYFDRHVRLPEESPTIGILLCQRKKQTIVELTLPKDANIHAREYELYLPSKELLKAKLLEWMREAERKA